MADASTTAHKIRIEIETSEDSVQSISPFNQLQRFEGVRFSPDGNVLAVVASDANTVFLFQRAENGRFEEVPFSFVTGGFSGLEYPHDVSFSDIGDTHLLAVAQRAGAISIFERPRSERYFRREPAFEIRGGKTGFRNSDAVAFIPSDDAHLAACDLAKNTVSFFQKTSETPMEFGLQPVFKLNHPSLSDPDGLAFSDCGRWLAVGNHGNHTVCVFKRPSDVLADDGICYELAPVSVIADPSLRHPHSVAFTPRTNHLVVTSAGMNYFSVHEPAETPGGMAWSNEPVLRVVVGSEHIFKEVNAKNKMEGGPKGIAIHGSNIAVCSPQCGVKIYTFSEFA